MKTGDTYIMFPLNFIRIKRFRVYMFFIYLEKLQIVLFLLKHRFSFKDLLPLTKLTSMFKKYILIAFRNPLFNDNEC